MAQSASDARLVHIQRLQFTDRAAAEALLADFVGETFPELAVARVELRPLAVSLNSFNGFLHLADGNRLFFKTHVEPNSIIGEYYNSQMLREAGYPVIQPRFASTEYGKQFLIYDVISTPSVFDMARTIERGERDDLPELRAAQNAADDRLLDIYRSTLAQQSAEDAARAPVHQLFHHRLVGGRYDQFYSRQPFILPHSTLTWADLLRRRWIINGQAYPEPLGQRIEQAKTLLAPMQAGLSVIGHGDAHNGNVFYTPPSLTYFDPAFGGRHHPILDITKPLFHNVRATWMYHPHEVSESLSIQYQDDGITLIVEHDYTPNAVRRMFEESKTERVLLPLLTELARRGEPESLNRARLAAALLCCPLLTMNLADRQKFPPQIGLLGVCLCLEVSADADA